jgi:hypothetical protein
VSTDNKIAEQGTEKKPAGEPAEEIMTNWELAATEPLAPEKKFRYKFRSSRDRSFYRSIPWPAWWDEFNSAIDKNGRRKHNLGLYLRQDENSLAENNTVGNDRTCAGTSL